ncbi:SDR family oxidoreductase [Smaragdicoccus niigatensis]
MFGGYGGRMASTSSRPVALVTGPTSGIGAGFADRLASRGYDLVLVARNEARMHDLAADLKRQYGARSEVLVADLADAQGRAAVEKRLAEGVQFLVNNAGFGLTGEFWSLTPEQLQAQLDVNVTAVLQFTRAALPAMMAAAKGDIINVASVAGLIPGRGSTYSASKAYVVSFTEGLAGALSGTGVRIQALCPGLVHTEFHERAGLELGKVPKSLWLDVDQVVSGSLNDLAAGKVVSVPSFQYKAITTAARLVPRRVSERLSSKVKGRRP